MSLEVIEQRKAGPPGWRSLAASPAVIAAASIAVLTLAAWAALLAEAFRDGGSAAAFIGALCRPAALDGLGAWSAVEAVAWSALLWIVMTAAMMLPTAAPMALAYAEIAEARAADGTPSPSPLVLIAGYLSVWAAVAIAASTLQAVAAWGWPLLGVPPQAAGVLAGFAIGAAGLYQFSDLKMRCLGFCRLPRSTLQAGVSERNADVFRLGLEQGRACLGCCGATMALMLLAGAMNLLWMSVFALLNTIEKLTTGPFASRLIGVGLIAAGLAAAVAAVGPEALWRAFLAR